MATGDDDDKKKLSVPKFSSFKPKGPASIPDAQSERPKAEQWERDERRRRSSRNDHRSQNRHQDRHWRERSHQEDEHRHQDRRRRERSYREEEHSDSRGREHARLSREDPRKLSDRISVPSVPGLFVVDKKGDPLLGRYGIERSKVPAYHRLRGGKVLGTDGRLFLHHDGPREEFSLLFPGDRWPRSHNTGGLRSRGWQTGSPVKLRARRGKSPKYSEQGYLSLDNPRKRKKLHQNSDPSDAEGQPSWRSIQGKAKEAKDADSGTEESDGSLNEPGVSGHDDPLKWKSIQLNRQVKDHPDDVEAWLELAEHQDTLLRDGETIDDRAAADTAHSFAEIKLHLLESALTHASCPEDRQRVLVALMREGVKVWDQNVAAKKWSQLSDTELRSFDLWKAHLDYFMSNIATFHYEDIKKVLLERLHQVVSRSGLQSKEDLEEAIYVFLRATKFFHDAGYKELASAAWQGLLELNLFRPESAQTQSGTLSAFEDFWETEGPRIGDTGAQGWRHHVESGRSEDVPGTGVDEEPAETLPRNPYRAWAAIERTRGERASLPARTMDADTDEDSFRAVMYSDIEPLLFVIPPDRLVDASRQLIDAFLLFCGLPPAFRSHDWLDTAYRDQYLSAKRTDLRPKPVWDAETVDEGASQRNPPSFSNGNCCARMSPELLFSSKNWFQYFDVAGTAALSWVEAALRQLVHSTPMPELALYYLGFCYATKPNTIKKHAKALLTRYSTDAQLYNAYALAELANGRTEIASKVLASALESPELRTASTGFLLFRTWSWMELERGDKMMATKRLCACVDDSLRKPKLSSDSVSPTTLLKARHAFASNVQQCLYERQWQTASSHVECLALFSYLTGEGGNEPTSTTQGNISAAMDVTDSISRDMRSGHRGNDAASELLFQWASRILYSHAVKGPYRRVYVREQLAHFIERFPRNTIFLNLFGWADATIRVVDETRQLLYDKVLVKKADSVSSRVFAIQHELESGNVNSTRAAFEHAVCSEACKHSALVWTWYIGFCQSQKQLQGQAKGVFYRALSHCPWSKEVMMKAFAVRGLESDELRSVYGTMTAKGLRIHVDLEEYLESGSAKAT